MPRLLLIFPILSYLFLAAHELRAGNLWIMAAWLLMGIMVLVWPRPWVRHLGAVTLMLGLFLWARVTVQLLQFRLAIDSPYTLLLVIMGGVAFLMALSIALMLSRTMQAWFGYSK
jgi:hypothetical protein